MHTHLSAHAFSRQMRAGERVLHTPNNPISLALTLFTLEAPKKSTSRQSTNTDVERAGEKDTSSDSDSGSDANRIRAHEENEIFFPKNVETDLFIEDIREEPSKKLPRKEGGEEEDSWGGVGVKTLRPTKKESQGGISFLGAMLFTRWEK